MDNKNHVYYLLFLLMISPFCSLSWAFTPGQNGSLTVTDPDTVVNVYGNLDEAVAAGSTQIRVVDSSIFTFLQEGDLLLIYQPQGAIIDTSNTFEYGTILDYRGAGQYEFVVFDGWQGSANSRRMNLTNECGTGLINSYDPSAQGPVQVIHVPQYTDLSIDSGASIIAQPWDGTTGGVVSFFVRDILTLSSGAMVDASGRGFRGAEYNDTDSSMRDVTLFVSDDEGAAAPKGEGIAGDLGDDRFGRGAPANAGGGGNQHNHGGGGGANAGNPDDWAIGSPPTAGGQGVMDPGPNGDWIQAWELDPGWAANGNSLTTSAGGGRGGYGFSQAFQDPLVVGPGDSDWSGDSRNPHGGLGGRPVVNDPATRLFMGGGGGAGDGNNQSGGGGGNGGGLVFIVANQVLGEGVIRANGQDGEDTFNEHRDAPGGAGGGGTIILRGNNIDDTITLEARGGKGGDQAWPPPPFGNAAEAEGPGGGGGGGFIALSGGGSPTQDVAGGKAGVVINRSFLDTFPVNGATDGGPGQIFGEAIGFINLCSGIITGRVFADLDGDGLENGDDFGLGAVEVEAQMARGGSMNFFTDADGNYSILVPIGSTELVVDESSDEIPFGSVHIPHPTEGNIITQTETSAYQTVNSTLGVGFQQQRPVMVFSERPIDGGDQTLTTIDAKTEYRYELTFSNVATSSTLAFSTNLEIINTLPFDQSWSDQLTLLDVEFIGVTGTFSQNDEELTITINESIFPGDTGRVILTVRTLDPIPNASIINNASLDFTDYDGENPEQLSDLSVLDVGVLLVELESLTVELCEEKNKLVIRWETSAEFGTMGFDVRRLHPTDEKVNQSFIPALGSPVSGGTYEYTDPLAPAPGEIRGYILVETEFSGKVWHYGPVWYPSIEGANTSVNDWLEFK